MTTTPPTVDEYLGRFSGELHTRLLRMRALIRQAAPEASEAISYGIVGYRYRGKPLAYFAGYPHHVGFYATPNGHSAFAADFAPYKQGKGSVQLPLDQPLPEDLIQRVVQFRIEDIESS